MTVVNSSNTHEVAHSKFNFDLLVEMVNANIDRVSENDAGAFSKMFRVNIEHANHGKSLYEIYLDSIPADERQELTCRTCKRWLESSGNLVTIDTDGNVQSVAFQTPDHVIAGLPVDVAEVILALEEAVTKSPVNGYRTVSRGSDTTIPNDGKWNHFRGALSRRVVLPKKVNYIGEENAAAEKVSVMRNALTRWPVDILSHAKALATYGALRDHRLAHRIKQFVDTAKMYNAIKDSRKRNALVWLWANTQTPDQTNVVGTATGMLLDALVEGGEDLALTRYIRETDGINYQRPTEEPTVRELDAAKALVAEKGWDRSLIRTAAKFADIQYLYWTPSGVDSAPAETTSIFDKVKAKDAAPAPKVIPGGSITEFDFMEKVLPKAQKLRVLINQHSRHPFSFFTKAEHPDAPPILKWDNEEQRNTVSAYAYNNGLSGQDANLSGWVNVQGITTTPEDWAKPEMRHGILAKGVMILEGGYDTLNSVSAIFPETLRHELRDARRVIESYSNSTPLVDKVGVAAIRFVPGLPVEAELEDGVVVQYTIK